MAFLADLRALTDELVTAITSTSEEVSLSLYIYIFIRIYNVTFTFVQLF